MKPTDNIPFYKRSVLPLLIGVQILILQQNSTHYEALFLLLEPFGQRVQSSHLWKQRLTGVLSKFGYIAATDQTTKTDTH